jgi:glycosyltransferase involved in cell wall biosynthesis
MITAVVTCMGRLEHLESALALTLAAFDRVIVVDWSCPQKSGEFAAGEGASVIYKYGEKFFSGSRAKNYGAKLVTTEYIAFVDADTMCMPGLKEEIASLLSPSRMILSARSVDGSDVNDTVGFLVCRTEAFWNVGGFDETWIGWGAEDIHLRGKLFLDERLEVVRLSGMVLGAIAHGNDIRSENREAPIEKTAVYNHKTLANWFASKGVSDYSRNPAVQDIVFRARE